MSKPIVSVIIPCFNCSKTVCSTLISLSNQKGVSDNDFEIILVNDGSTDLTGKVISNFKREMKKKNIKIVSLAKNKGVSFARNQGIKCAEGDWILFLDSDDFLNPDAIAGVIRNYRNYPYCDLLAFGYYVESKKRKVDYSSKKYSGSLMRNQELFQLFMSKKIYMHISSIAYKRDFLNKNKIRFVVGRKIAEDLEFIILCLYFSKHSFYDCYHIFNYQIYNSTAMNKYQKYTLNMGESIENLDNFLSQLSNTQNMDYLNYYLVNFYVYNIKLLFKSKSYSKKAVYLLLKKRSLLRMKIKPLNKKRSFILKIMRILPIEFLLRCYLWRK